MNVALQLNKTVFSQNSGKSMILRDVELDTALAISATLRDLVNADVEAVIVVEDLPSPSLASAPHKPARSGALISLARWLRGVWNLAGSTTLPH